MSSYPSAFANTFVSTPVRSTAEVSPTCRAAASDKFGSGLKQMRAA
jgi:hypothetical protein